MTAFLRRADISYACFKVDKNFIGDKQGLHDPPLQQIVRFLMDHTDEFAAFDKLKVYYDNGQDDLTALLKEARTPSPSRRS